MNDNKTTFVTNKVTNQDIYKKLLDHDCQFESVKQKQDLTNGKVKLSKWVATTALMLTLLVLGFLIQHINK